MWGGLGVQQGLGDFTALLQKSIVFAHLAFACRSSSCVLPPTLPPLWMFFLLSICASFHRGSQCDGGWWVPLIGLSWLPSRLACVPPLFHQAPSPHPSTCIVHGFKLDFYARANLRRRSSPCRYLAGTLSLSVLSPFSLSFSKGQ